jgi:hypothetical protein
VNPGPHARHALEAGPDRRTGTRRGLLAAMLTLLALALIVPELDLPGVTWDEPEYFASVERIQAWTATLITVPRKALDSAAIQAAWDPQEVRYYNPHPPVYKEGMAATEFLFGRYLGPVAGYRLSAALMFALLVGVVTWTVAGVAGAVGGFGAGTALILMPRVFGHAHIAATDMPLTCFWALSTLAFAAYLRRGRTSAILLAALALGLALGTKFTGWLLPVPLLVWAILERRWWPWLVTVLLSLVTAYVMVPSAWYDPIGAVSRLFVESMSREQTIPLTTVYLGRIYEYAVPWQQSIVMTLITVPLGVLCLSLFGCADAVRDKAILRPKDDRAVLARLSILQIGFFLGLMALPASPNHDGVRLFLPMFPFVALLSGLGLSRIHELLRARFDSRQAALGCLLLGSLFLLPAWRQNRQVRPYYLSYYNELIGGLPGAARAGMEVTYWYDAMTPDFLRRIERELPEGATVLGWPRVKYFEELQDLGLLRADLRFTNELSSAYLLLLARKATLPPPLLEVYEQVQPILAVELDGVELAGLYALSGPE